MSSDDATDDDHEQFKTWLAADPLHESSYRAAESVFNDFTELKHLRQERPLESNSTPMPDRVAAVEGSKPQPYPALTRRTVSLASAIAASVIVAAAVGWLLVSDRLAISPQRYETALAETRAVSLPDGSVVTLSGKTVINVAFDKSARSVSLQSGQAFFEVAHNERLPFVVTAGEAIVHVVGTKFDVRIGPEAVGISVLEGKVRVASASENKFAPVADGAVDDTKVLIAGQKISAQNSGDLTPIQPVSVDKPGAWRDGMLIYEDAKLLDLVADVNRYYSGGIEFADNDISDLRVTAAFRPNQIDQMLQTLTRAYPLQARHDGSGRIVLGRPAEQR
tara:strand:- start:9900 stop:10904 length:1005 start_codon:yes stop_codon:yes gene_type:complete